MPGQRIPNRGGFIVHFFDERLVDRLAAGFEYMYSNDVSGRENNTMIMA